MIVLLFKEYKPNTVTDKWIGVSLPLKLAFKLINDDYPAFVSTFYIKFGKLQISAYHGPPT